MAESKNKPAPNTAGGKPAKEFQLMAWLKLTKTIAAESDGFKNYADLLQNKKELETDLEDKTKELEKLRERCTKMESDLVGIERESKMKCEHMASIFGERYLAWKQEEDVVRKRDDKIERLSAELQSIKANEKKQQSKYGLLDKDLKSATANNAELKSDISKMTKHCKVVEAKLHACETERDEFKDRLQEATANLGEGVLKTLSDPELNDLSRELADISTRFHRLVHDFLSDTGETRNSGTMLDAIDKLSRFHIPLPPLATKEAMLMRCAAVEAFIAETVMKHVFRSFYVPEYVGDGAEVVLDHFGMDPNRQNIYRCQLLKLCEEHEGFDSGRVVARATDVIYITLHSLVPPAKMEEFRNHLSGLLELAVGVWSERVLHSRSLILAIEPTDADSNLASHDVYGARSESGTAKRSIAAQLFPRVLIDGTNYILHPGIVLWEDQPAVLIARDQLKQLPTTNGVLPRHISNRRPSIAGQKTPLSSRIRP